MTIVLILGGALVAGIALVLALAARKPDTVRYERRAAIAAPPEAIFALINDFHRWVDWSPWEKLDPTMAKTFGGPDQGVGATYAWKGNGKVGEGQMTILESTPSQRVTIRLEFIKPIAADNSTVFTITSVAAGSEVTWVMEGENTFMGKVMSVFMDMDKMIGKSFDEGLAALGAAAQGK